VHIQLVEDKLDEELEEKKSKKQTNNELFHGREREVRKKASRQYAEFRVLAAES
jgi:hypothetical protein